MKECHKDKANKSAQKVFNWETDFASITLFQSSKLQAKAYSWNDETLNQDLPILPTTDSKICWGFQN